METTSDITIIALQVQAKRAATKVHSFSSLQ